MASTIRGDDDFDSSVIVGWLRRTIQAPSRVLDTPYTNNLAYPIELNVNIATIGAGSTTVTMLLDGIPIAIVTQDVGGGLAHFNYTVPAGSTYQLNSGNITIHSWRELR